MAEYVPYHMRKRLEARGEEPEVYTFDNLPSFLGRQISLAIGDGVGAFSNDPYFDHACANKSWVKLDAFLRRKVPSYPRDEIYTPRHQVMHFIEHCTDTDELLTAVEVCCIEMLALDKEGGPRDVNYRGARSSGREAIDEINRAFNEHAVGYTFENHEIIRVDSKLVHSEIVKPALRLLNEPIFAKANEEFMTAHRHYRTNHYKDAVAAANRAFESMLKAICDTEGWKYEKGFRAPELVTTVTTNGLFTHDFDKGFQSYVAMMKTGLPTVRNETGGHGEGLAAAAVTSDIARYAINLTASNIVFLGDAYRALKGRAV